MQPVSRPVIENCTDYFSKRGRISFRTKQPYNRIRDPISLRLRHIWFNFESIFCLRRIAKNCLRKFGRTFAAFFVAAERNTKLFSFLSFHFGIRVKWDLRHTTHTHTLTHVCEERDVASTIERAIIIYSTNWIVKFKFIRNSSFPRGSHRKKSSEWLGPRWLGSLAHSCFDSLFFLPPPNWTQPTWNGLVTVWKRKVSR